MSLPTIEELEHSGLTYDEVLDLSGMNDDEFVQHYGVKGMKWGVRRAAKKAFVGDPDKSGVTRRDKRVAVRKERRKINDELEDIADGPRMDRDIAIKSARANIKKELREYRDAKDLYKENKEKIGKNAAKIELKKAQLKLIKTETLSEGETSNEELSRLGRELIESLFSGPPVPPGMNRRR